MSSHAGIRMIALVSVLTVSASFAADGPPAWAYGFPQPGAPAAPAGGRGRGGQGAPDNSAKRLAGSNLEFTLTQIRDGFGPADWFPGDHPKMPEIVAHGRRPEVIAPLPQPERHRVLPRQLRHRQQHGPQEMVGLARHCKRSLSQQPGPGPPAQRSLDLHRVPLDLRQGGAQKLVHILSGATV